jgi:hypothetical protein
MCSRFTKKSLYEANQAGGGDAVKAGGVLNNKEKKTNEHEKHNKSAQANDKELASLTGCTEEETSTAQTQGDMMIQWLVHRILNHRLTRGS